VQVDDKYMRPQLSRKRNTVQLLMMLPLPIAKVLNVLMPPHIAKVLEMTSYQAMKNRRNLTMETLLKLILTHSSNLIWKLLKNDIGREDELRQKKRKGNKSELETIMLNKVPKSDNINDKQPNKMVWKVEKFETLNYSLGPNEEYIAIKSCEYNA
nr:hypothetical protein [Tanacetum cinerariifolium]